MKQEELQQIKDDVQTLAKSVQKILEVIAKMEKQILILNNK